MGITNQDDEGMVSAENWCGPGPDREHPHRGAGRSGGLGPRFVDIHESFMDDRGYEKISCAIHSGKVCCGREGIPHSHFGEGPCETELRSQLESGQKYIDLLFAGLRQPAVQSSFVEQAFQGL